MQFAAGSAGSQPIGSGRAGSVARVDMLVIVAVIALLVGFANRALVGWQTPLWFDETFTAVIATQTQGQRLWAWLTGEIGGPTYYLLIWAWEKLAGDSNIALRVPGFVASLAGPAIVLRWGHADRRTRLIWASLLALYTPSFLQATEARSYALLTLFTTLQAIAFLRLLDAPSLRRASLWVAISGLCILTHYHGGIISLIQGLFYLGYWRMRALRTWPAILILIPVAVWMAVQLPSVLSFAAPGVAWYSTLSPWQIVYLPGLFLNYPVAGMWLLAGMIVTALAAAFRADIARMFRFSGPEALTAGSALMAAVAVFAIGCITPSFTPRYIIPFAPAALLGVALWLARVDRLYARASAVTIVVLSIFAAGLLRNSLADPAEHPRYAFNLEMPSDWIRREGAGQNLVFLWDNPTAATAKPSYMEEIAGYFLRRKGQRPDVYIGHLPANVDPFPRLIARAAALPGGAVLWVYDTSVPLTRGIVFPADPDRFPDWRCRNFGRESITVLACVRKG